MSKKHIVLIVLFILPVVIYLFFASGVYNFTHLPEVTKNVSETSRFKDAKGNSVSLSDKVTLLGFLGRDVLRLFRLRYCPLYRIVIYRCLTILIFSGFYAIYFVLQFFTPLGLIPSTQSNYINMDHNELHIFFLREELKEMKKTFFCALFC